MNNNIYTKLPLGEVRPKGWLLDQLLAQEEGLSGNVMELFKDLSLESSWLGGKGECWERGPYYLDGLMPLAFLLDSKKLIEKAMQWINSVLESQDLEGLFGPKNSLDWWPRMVVTKMLPDYYEVSKDNRVIPFLSKYYSYMNRTIDERPFFSWASVRALEELIGIKWLYQQTKDEMLLELVNKIFSYRFDWNKEFDNFRWPKASKSYISSKGFNVKKIVFYAPDFLRNFFKSKERPKQKTIARENSHFNQFYHCTHGVNIAMALKYPALEGMFKGEKASYGLARKGYQTVMMENGTATNLFTCDEHLSGPNPFQGIELCTVAETMYSSEKLMEITGDRFWADLLESLAYNALPATFTFDMCAHQYVQQTNQISSTIAKRTWYDSYNKSNIYGLKPNYACCLSNMHQAFPKFAQNLVFKSSDSLVIIAPVSCSVNTKIKDKEIALDILGDYPFKNHCSIKCLKGEAKLVLLKPSFAEKIIINELEFSQNEIAFDIKEGETLEVKYEFRFKVRDNQDGSISYYYGPFLMALPIDAKVKIGKTRFSDREMRPVSEWRYALSRKIETPKIYYEERSSKYPFQYPKISIDVTARRVNWKINNNQCDTISSVTSIKDAIDETIKLVPYGFTDLRIAQFPAIEDLF